MAQDFQMAHKHRPSTTISTRRVRDRPDDRTGYITEYSQVFKQLSVISITAYSKILEYPSRTVSVCPPLTLPINDSGGAIWGFSGGQII
jgi:hypothetical protein